MSVSTSAPDRSASQSADEALRAKQVQQAEELLFSGPAGTGFAKALFRGEFHGQGLFPYPELAASDAPRSKQPCRRYGSSPTNTSTPPRSTVMPTFPARSLTGWPTWAFWA